jgi:hypothetical protein
MQTSMMRLKDTPMVENCQQNGKKPETGLFSSNAASFTHQSQLSCEIGVSGSWLMQMGGVGVRRITVDCFFRTSFMNSPMLEVTKPNRG